MTTDPQGPQGPRTYVLTQAEWHYFRENTYAGLNHSTPGLLRQMNAIVQAVEQRNRREDQQP